MLYTPRSDIESENRDEKDQNIFDEKSEVVTESTDKIFSSKKMKIFFCRIPLLMSDLGYTI